MAKLGSGEARRPGGYEPGSPRDNLFDAPNALNAPNPLNPRDRISRRDAGNAEKSLKT